MIAAQELEKIALGFPKEVHTFGAYEIKRVLFHVSLVEEHAKAPLTLCDVGGGIGLFPIAAAEAGMTTYVIDDFDDPSARLCGDCVLDISASHGVKFIRGDVLKMPFPFPSNSLDVITCFDSMEHWHSSPKRLFSDCMKALRPGGLFILSVPNCVNLRKRITVPFGYGKWSRMEDWYETDVFRSHVREPDVDDLVYIANDMGLADFEIIGRNWLGYFQGSAMRIMTFMADPFLRLFPSLCSSLYLVGRRNQAATAFECEQHHDTVD
jgi:SAM-dependent methyltransferase